MYGPSRKKEKKKKKEEKLVCKLWQWMPVELDHYFIVFLFSSVISRLVETTKHESSLNLASNEEVA